MKVGIVGMPNAGKSSLFNALTKAGAEAANYPFTTIEPNVAIVPVHDHRMTKLSLLLNSKEVVWDTIAFHDIVSDPVPGVGVVWQEAKERYGDRFEFHEFTGQYDELLQRTGTTWLGLGLAVRRDDA